jgi:succinyl-CoA synthetase alpha subunit
MSIYLTETTRAIIQGGTGRIGRVQAQWMRACGTNLVAGVTPGRGGSDIDGLPVYDCVSEAVEEHRANAAVLFTPAPYTKDAVLESIDAGIELVVAVPEHVPVHDAIEMKRAARKQGAVLLGPNCPGIITPGVGKLGIMPANLFSEGRIGLISRSGTLSYEAAGYVIAGGMGISTLLGIGGDPVIGMEIESILEAYENDPGTEAVVLVGEIGGSAEEQASEYIGRMKKPVVAYIAGRSAPEGRTLGHAGAIIRKGSGSVDSKIKILSKAGARVAKALADIPNILKESLGGS